MVYLILHEQDYEISLFVSFIDLQEFIMDYLKDCIFEDLAYYFMSNYIVYDIGNNINKLIGKNIRDLPKLSKKDIDDIINLKKVKKV